MKKIVVTGGTRGLGFSLVENFLKQGNFVIFTGTKIETVNAATEKLIDFKGMFRGVVCDSANYDDLNKLIKNDKVDVWINNAGINHIVEKTEDISPDIVSKIVDVNCKGIVYGTQIAIKHFKENNIAGIVYNMEGLGSNNMNIPGTSIYSSSKSFLTKYSKIVNKENKRNIFMVGTISPGMVATDLLTGGMTNEGKKIANILADRPQVVASYIVNKIAKRQKKIVWLTNAKTIWRFTVSLFVKRNII